MARVLDIHQPVLLFMLRLGPDLNSWLGTCIWHHSVMVSCYVCRPSSHGYLPGCQRQGASWRFSFLGWRGPLWGGRPV